MKTQPLPGSIIGWVELHDPGEEAAYRDIWQQNVYQLGREHLDGALVLDIGSNIGLFTAFALDNGADHVIAVDPVVAHLDRSRVLLGTAHGRITYWHAAAGDGHPMVFGPGAGVDQTMIPASSETYTRYDGAGQIEERVTTVDDDAVRGVTLDELLRHAPPSSANRVIVKIDCEGSEYAFIDAASDHALRSVWRFTMEWHGQMGARRESAAGLIGRMVERLVYTHSVTVFGDPNHGGMLYAYRY